VVYVPQSLIESRDYPHGWSVVNMVRATPKKGKEKACKTSSPRGGDGVGLGEAEGETASMTSDVARATALASDNDDDESPEDISLAASKSDALALKNCEVQAVQRYYFLGYCKSLTLSQNFLVCFRFKTSVKEKRRQKAELYKKQKVVGIHDLYSALSTLTNVFI